LNTYIIQYKCINSAVFLATYILTLQTKAISRNQSHEKTSKTIFPNVQSHYFEVDGAKYIRYVHACPLLDTYHIARNFCRTLFLEILESSGIF